MSNKIQTPVNIPLSVRNSQNSIIRNIPPLQGSSYFSNYQNDSQEDETEAVLDPDVSFKIRIDSNNPEFSLLDLFHIEISDSNINNNNLNSPTSQNSNANLSVPVTPHHYSFSTIVEREYLDEYKNNVQLNDEKNVEKKEFLKQIETEVTGAFLRQSVENVSPKSLYLKLYDEVTMIFDKQFDKINRNNT